MKTNDMPGSYVTLPPHRTQAGDQRGQQLRSAATLQRTPRGQMLALPQQTRPEHTLFRNLGVPLDERYKIKKVLGQGAFGKVMLAKDRQSGQNVAIKEIYRVEDPNQELEIELELLALVRATRGSPRCHPNVVCYFAHFLALPSRQASAPVRYIVMEYIEGESLRNYIDRKKQIAGPVAMHIVQDVARGLQFLHSKGIAHRDVKPANIMLRRDAKTPTAVLVDLGLACFQNEKVRTDMGDRAECSFVAGSRYYMAPEILQGAVPLNVESWMRSDMYALGRVGEELGLANQALVQMLLHPDPFQRPKA